MARPSRYPNEKSRDRTAVGDCNEQSARETRPGGTQAVTWTDRPRNDSSSRKVISGVEGGSRRSPADCDSPLQFMYLNTVTEAPAQASRVSPINAKSLNTQRVVNLRTRLTDGQPRTDSANNYQTSNGPRAVIVVKLISPAKTRARAGPNKADRRLPSGLPTCGACSRKPMLAS